MSNCTASGREEPPQLRPLPVRNRTPSPNLHQDLLVSKSSGVIWPNTWINSAFSRRLDKVTSQAPFRPILFYDNILPALPTRLLPQIKAQPHTATPTLLPPIPYCWKPTPYLCSSPHPSQDSQVVPLSSTYTISPAPFSHSYTISVPFLSTDQLRREPLTSG